MPPPFLQPSYALLSRFEKVASGDLASLNLASGWKPVARSATFKEQTQAKARDYIFWTLSQVLRNVLSEVGQCGSDQIRIKLRS